MIQAKELKIGNLFLFTDEPKEIRSITGSHIEYAERYNGWFNSFFEPILITEEWLLKFGFTQTDKGVYVLWCSNYQKIQYIFSTISETQSVIYNNAFINNILYIHQLQNLYFALTQKELTII